MRKLFFTISCIIFSLTSFSQRYEFLSDLSIDSTFSLLGMGQCYDKTADSLERFWFILDKESDILKLKNDFSFKKKVPTVFFDKNSIDLLLLKDKKLIKTVGVIFPLQKAFVSNGKGWYAFDTTLLQKLHTEHPLKYHYKNYSFDTYLEYAFFRDSIESQPNFLYLDEPEMKFQGKFSLIVNKDPETSNSIFAEIALKKELSSMVPENQFKTDLVLNDKFNMNHTDKVKIIVKSSKSLYDNYTNKGNIKGDWEPNLIQTKVYFKD